MKHTLRLGFAAVGIGMAVGAAGQTADELIAKNVEARGGLEKIRAIESMRLTGTLSIGDAKMPSVLEVKRPNKTRWEFTLEGQMAVQAYDGTTAWAVAPFAGKPDPEPMSAEDLKDMELQADMDGPLVDYRAKGHRVEVMGLEKFGGRDAWRLRVTLRNGDVRDVYLDLKTHLQIVTVAHRVVQGKPAEIESELGDYRQVGGVMLPYFFETRVRGVPQKQSVRFEKIELNVPIDDSRFRMPVPKNEPERAQPIPATPTPPASPRSGTPPGTTARREERLYRPYAPFSGGASRMTSTEQGACAAIASETLPSSRRSSPCRPWLPTTTRSACQSRQASISRLLGSPVSTALERASGAPSSSPRAVLTAS